MKKSIFTVLAVFSFVFTQAQTGVGFRLGDPYGLNIRAFTNDNFAIDLTLGGNRILRTLRIIPVTNGIAYGGPTVMVNFEYQGSFGRGSDVDFYFGGGLSYRWMGFSKLGDPSPITGTYVEHVVSIGIVGGIEWHIGGGDTVLFLEIAPQVEMTPKLGAGYGNPGGGLRWYL